jgi:hypothetical protein
MADCDLCGVSRPTLCPVKVFVPRFEKTYPKGTWKGLCESCTAHLHDAKAACVEVEAKKCDLCGAKNITLYRATITIPNFEPPYHTEEEKHICEACLEAVEEVYRKHEARIKGEEVAHH